MTHADFDLVYFDFDPDDGDLVYETSSDWCDSVEHGKHMAAHAECMFFMVFRLSGPFGKRVGIAYVSPMRNV